ncbi:hypothetical protein FDB30_07935 [Clostridium botulinum]|uniref:hypothetical protein n=1 Tax=Clostridium botulinum TaxID=1491 RepID=UPI000772D5F6|nr:hypothetical protein [Clostridium botulinum]MBN1049351.1 hypothetical protein [Clostridium botulinum]MBN1078350.1 hypothetical protein [Clostridium botulinum]NFE85570.1 hypothetical protein [Clostridium botulinum]NFG37131.1 hypothetical protein [Clostridium botulinum]NFN29250.1 hypothetical protein [Clostridium botulinum]
MKKRYFIIYIFIFTLIVSLFYLDKNCFNLDLISLKHEMHKSEYRLDLERSKMDYIFNSTQLVDTLNGSFIRIYCFNSDSDAKERLDTLINISSKYNISKPEYEDVYLTFFLCNSLIVMVEGNDEKTLNTLISIIGTPYHSIIKEWPNSYNMKLI